jgi:hypothetical protein
MRRNLVAVDPGKDMLGLSFWQDGKLVHAEWAPVKGARLAPPISDWEGGDTSLVMELPRARHPSATPGGVKGYQALIDITFAGARYLGLAFGCFERTIFPDEWKGSIGKPKKASEPYLIEARVLGLLSPEERARIAWPTAQGKRHNVADAIGLGLFALGRCGRGATRL